MKGEVTEQVVEAVSAATDRDALALPPLAASIDPDVLNGLVEGTGNGTLTFTYVGREVTVTHDREVRVSNVLPVRRSNRPAMSSRAGN
jgi:hypothetical protein